MIDAILGDGGETSPIAMAVIAIVIAALVFGGCMSGGECNGCQVAAVEQTAK